MSEFRELVKNFDKIREYMRDFYIYGFKIRKDFTQKSARTYDNERRRIESWLCNFVGWDNSVRGKNVFISVDSRTVSQNPLYAAWKSKSFTKTDIMLHFFLLDILSEGESFSIEALTDAICEKYSVIMDTQTVRGKLREYVSHGIICSQKQGKSLLYHRQESLIEKLPLYPALLEAVKLFQEVMPFGFIGMTILDKEGMKNTSIRFKHHYMVHTLEDGVLYTILQAIKEHKGLLIENYSRKSKKTALLYAIPLCVRTGTQTGRRYLCVYKQGNNLFMNIRLDSIISVVLGDYVPFYRSLQERLATQIPKCWGVSFGTGVCKEQLYIKFFVDEKTEQYIIERIKREGRGGELLRLQPNVFLYSMTTFDTNEMLPWIKTFTGRILSVDGTNQWVLNKFYSDMDAMYELYCKEERDGAILGNL